MAKKTNRDDELAKRPKIRDRLLDVFKDVEKGFADQRERADSNIDYWECYNNQLGDRQFYNGNSQIFLPITHDAIEARKTRFVNQLFPRSGRYVEVTTTDDNHIPSRSNFAWVWTGASQAPRGCTGAGGASETGTNTCFASMFIVRRSCPR